MLMISKLFSKFRKTAAPKVRFYCLEPGVADIFPITRSASIKRKWMSDDTQEFVSSVNCPGVNKIVSSGWVMLAPADFIISTTGDGVHLEWLEPLDSLKKSTNGFKSIMNFIMATDNSHLLPNFIEATKKIDMIRNENFWEVFPELTGVCDL